MASAASAGDGGSAFGGRVTDTLICEARAGDPSALGALLDSYRNYLRVLARTSLDGRLATKLDASDLVQEALLKASEGFGGFRGRSEHELLAWLRQILTRTLIDTVRRYELAATRQIDRERSLDAAVEESSQSLARFMAGHGPSPSAVAQRREVGVVLADALSALRPEHREVIVLRSLRELDWKEVGRCMGRKPDAARMLWARALAQLGPLLLRLRP